MRFARKNRTENGRILRLRYLSVTFFCLLVVFIENSSAESFENITNKSTTTTSSVVPQNSRQTYENVARIFRRLPWLRKWNNRRDDEEPHQLTTTELVEQAGFEIKTKFVTTEDGYILALDRILLPKSGEIKDKNNFTKKEKKPVVLLFTGLLGCADSWVAGSPNNSLAFILTRLNYDVYLANPRGCVYSKRHQWKNPNSKEFWDFSYHEIGVYDLKAFVDFILKETGQSKLNYIGLSMGTTVNYVLLSERPEYNDKFNMSIGLGCLFNFENSLNPAFALLRNFPKNLFSRLLHLLPNQEIATKTSLLHSLFTEICSNPRVTETCWNLYFSAMGFDSCQSIKNHSLLVNLSDVYPAGSSLKVGLHYGQNANSGIFRQYNYDIRQNLLKYGSPDPPAYNLSHIQSQQVLFYSDNDWGADPKDVAKLAASFSPKAKAMMCRVKFPDWNHIDYIVARDVNLLANDRIIQALQGNTCWRNKDPEDDKLNEDIKCPATKNARPLSLNSIFGMLDRQVRRQRL